MSIVLDGSNVSTVGVLNLGTAQASTSGTSITFTGIPSGTKRIILMMASVTTSSSSYWQVQLGSGSLATSGYNSGMTYVVNATASTTNASTGFLINTSTNNTTSYSGQIILNLINTNKWVGSVILAQDASARALYGAGSVSLSGILDRISLTTVNGTDTFTAGTVNIQYE